MASRLQRVCLSAGIIFLLTCVVLVRTSTPCHDSKEPCSQVDPPDASRPSRTCSHHPSCDKFPCEVACNQTLRPCNGLVFEELWDKLDFDTWEHELTLAGGGTWEFQQFVNSRRNSYVRDGTLWLRPTLTAEIHGEELVRNGTLDIWGMKASDRCTAHGFRGCERSAYPGLFVVNPVQAASLHTAQSFAFTYGRVEVTAKMSSGDWLWSGISLVPKRDVYGAWPLSGEISIAQTRGNGDLRDAMGVSHGANEVASTLHWGASLNLDQWWRTHVTKHATEGTFASSFHKYEMERTRDYVRFLLDGKETLKVDPGTGGFWDLGEFPATVDNPWKGAEKVAPFDQEFYLKLNLAVGGSVFFPDQWTNRPNPKPWTNYAPTAMLDFYNAKGDWFPTWKREENNGEGAALQIKDIRVWAYE